MGAFLANKVQKGRILFYSETKTIFDEYDPLTTGFSGWLLSHAPLSRTVVRKSSALGGLRIMIVKNVYFQRVAELAKKVKTRCKSAIDHSKRKIFCIGFNKTGTSSLHLFFENLGLTSTHNVFRPVHSKAQRIDKNLFYYQCYSDGEKADFIALDSTFPNSLFILNNRNECDWLYSRLKHVMRYNQNIANSNILTDNKYGWMARDFF